MSHTFAIGDIHGQAVMLAALIDQLRTHADDGDTLLFIGDYIDRGPDSRGVVDQVLALRDGGWDGPVVTLCGNHEDMMLDEARDRKRYDAALWLYNGGAQTLKSYAGDDWRRWCRPTGSHGFLPETHQLFFSSLALHHEDEHAFYVHAGFRPGFPADRQSVNDLLWIREDFIDSSYAWDKPVVFGHTPQAEGGRMIVIPSETAWRPLSRPEKIGIDTGACYGGPLTAVVLPEREFFRVPPTGGRP